MSIRDEIRRLARSAPSRFACTAGVQAINPVTANFYRVTVRGDGLIDYRVAFPADAFRIAVPPEEARERAAPVVVDAQGRLTGPTSAPAPVQRAYTVRHFDSENRTLTFDVALHEFGPMMTWLGHARCGDVVGLLGTRHDFVPSDEVDHYLLVADSSGVPAVAAVLESLPPTVTATVFVQVESPDDRALVPEHPGAEIYWTISPPCSGANSPLELAVRSHPRTHGRTLTWIAAEASVVRPLRQFALHQLDIHRDDLHAVAYWKAGQSGAERDAISTEKYSKALRDGVDITDPAAAAEIEFA